MEQVIDAQTDSSTNGTFATGDDPYDDFGSTETGDGVHHATTYARDALGRVTTVTVRADLGTPIRVARSHLTRLVDDRLVALRISLADLSRPRA